MSRTFTKLFSSITESTIWCESDQTRIVWIAMLAMADHAGRVWSSVPGLANRARVPIEAAEEALQTFMSPDPYSRTAEYEGRRIEPIDGGWRLLNHAKYRAIRDEESIKESKRRYINERRAAEREEAEKAATVEKSRTVSNAVDRGRANAEADTEAEADTKKQKPKTAPDGVLFPGVSEQVIRDFKALRNKLNAPVTETAMAGIRREAEKAGLSLEQVMAMCCERGWRGFKAEWVQGTAKNEPAALPRLLA